MVILTFFFHIFLSFFIDMDLKKMSMDKSLHAFKMSDLREFLVPTTSGDPGQILTSGEKSRVCLREVSWENMALKLGRRWYMLHI